MRRKKTKAKRKTTQRCKCKKAPSLDKMTLSTLRTKAKQIDKAIAKRTKSVGVHKRSRKSAEFIGPVHRPYVGAHEFSD